MGKVHLVQYFDPTADAFQVMLDVSATSSVLLVWLGMVAGNPLTLSDDSMFTDLRGSLVLWRYFRGIEF